MSKHAAMQPALDARTASDFALDWQWPLPRLDGSAPAIIVPWDSARADELVQLGYHDRGSLPERLPVFAPADGSITYAGRGALGGTVCLAHPGALATLCSGLETLLVPGTDARGHRRARVRAGDVLGYLRNSLSLGFRMTRWIQRSWLAIDPATVVQRWTLQPWLTDYTLDAARIAVGA